ncbi:hypothetical protein EJ02DRAFT_503592 [Clathrospora elynae]|uniref:Rhodopsin domain-containing protein n=1 Tax=Clathrospora elynae TaxID=706981 RepID=A0A6A5SKR6_9PLEO|nr:hypothetical protein EJ02DRAFT_503592 [Clathrospora elynae]
MVENRQHEVLGIVCAFTVLAALFVAMRMWSRYLQRNFSWDDYLIMIAMFILLGDTVGTWTYILLSGTGYHIYDLPKKSIPEQLVALRWNFAVQMFYHPLMGLIRASIIMFLFRMKDHRRRIRYSLHAVFWLNILYSVGTTLVNILQCKPTRYTWSRPEMDSIGADGKVVPAGTCIDPRTFILTSCSFSIFMDLIIIPIPSVMVWNLQMCKRTKALVAVVMSLGWIATGVSVGRFIVYYYRFAPSNTDRTWNIGIAISIAEPAVHIMTACAPATKCLFRYLFPYYGKQRTPYYEERTATRPRKSGSRGSRTLGNFSFGVSNAREDEIAMEPGYEARGNRGAPKTESVWDLQDRDSVESRDRNEDTAEHAPPRTSCSKTGHTETSEPIEAEPKHCLGQAR